MRTSVVMTTYNGARFLIDMLDSLRVQTRQIDEVLIFDDQSNDNTVEIIRDYIARYELKDWKVTVNEKNKGWEKNFRQGIEKASGDIIFPCDQDDIWHCDKIEKMTCAFEENPNIGLLVSGYHAFSENGGKVCVQNAVKTGSVNVVSKIVFDEHYYAILRPGCTMAFCKELVPLFLKNWRNGSPHDAVLWTIAALIDKLYLYNEIFIEFRRHGGNASKSISHEYFYKVNEPYRTQIINQWYVESEYYNPERQPIIDDCNQWCILRKELLIHGRIVAWLKLFKYRQYYLTSKKYFGDLYYFFQQYKEKNVEVRKQFDF